MERSGLATCLKGSRTRKQVSGLEKVGKFEDRSLV